ncbi:SET domain-containing protein-lysine N-methyltransferase [Burkholderia ubonensis]|uniref:SET domain-containing protein n=1 Tax=Burkholderia ubonensis TaxID=101571 RepID=UPI000751A9EE|nr:SET domain-containing protein-lysine N-methyltransferase [Burkholderia ubonensis]KWA71738.1 SET domain-containing protein-lysine N-methyltransferase [Burkholderia ubonensis]
MQRVVVRRSVVHGRGVFAVRPLRAGERIFEYLGESTTWQAAVQRYESRGDDAHTFLFGLSDGRVIDGGRGGNSARWLNHACAPNCETVEIDGRVFINATHDILTGEELFIGYALEVDESTSNDERATYWCKCGVPACRGTMLGITSGRETR